MFFLLAAEFHGNVAGDNRADTPEVAEQEAAEQDDLYLDEAVNKLNLNDVSNVGDAFDGSYTRIDDV